MFQWLQNNTRLWILGILVATLIGVSGCLDMDSESSRCSDVQVPFDQKGSFMAIVDAYPLSLIADSRLSPQQRHAITEAVETWNQFGQKIIKQNLFNLGFSEISETIKGMNAGDCRQNFGGVGDLYLVRETSQEHWQDLGLTKSVPGATFRCERGGELVQQVIFVFPEAIQSPQFSSVVLHELGHSIGLDHSCLSGNGSREDFRSCVGLELSHAYRQAVMYPWLHVSSNKANLLGVLDIPEIKDTLRSNDQLRAECVLSSS